MARPKRPAAVKPLDRLVGAAKAAKEFDEAAALPAGSSEPERVAKKWTEGMARHFRERFAWQLRELRTRAGLSLHALAARAGTNHSQLVGLEAAERSCTLETAVKIGGALGVSLGILIDEKGSGK